ncbi:MAG: nickel-dependent hydrogenase large subunit [Thermodesulfovibrionales bacterium]
MVKRVIKVDYIPRVEGEGGIVIEIKDGAVLRLHMKVFEAPRFFESFLRGRPYSDAVDFTARICGICPVAYQMSSVHAIENIFGIEVDRPIRELRRLFYCGEWIESHALHVYLLQGPDFYGIESAWADKKYVTVAMRGLNLKKIGNQIITIIGGRAIHPISVRVGGFYRIPDKRQLTSILPELERAYGESLNGIKWASNLQFKDNPVDMEFVSLMHPDEYPMNEGRVVSNRGLDKTMDGFLECIQEYQVEYSTALHSGIKRDSSISPYIVGPISRLNLNHKKLPAEIKDIIRESGVTLPIRDTEMGIIARSIEIAYALYEAIRIIKDYEMPDRAFTDFEPKAGAATWITEAPRGILIHRYELSDKGDILDCKLIPPTSQNLGHIEKDLLHFIENNIGKPSDFLKKGSEKIVRGYDPCISCSVHLLM